MNDNGINLIFSILNVILVSYGFNYFKKKNLSNYKIGLLVLIQTWIYLGIIHGIVSQSFDENNDIIGVLMFNLPFTLIFGGFTFWYKVVKSK